MEDFLVAYVHHINKTCKRFSSCPLPCGSLEKHWQLRHADMEKLSCIIQTFCHLGQPAVTRGDLVIWSHQAIRVIVEPGTEFIKLAVYWLVCYSSLVIVTPDPCRFSQWGSNNTFLELTWELSWAGGQRYIPTVDIIIPHKLIRHRQHLQEFTVTAVTGADVCQGLFKIFNHIHCVCHWYVDGL